MVGPALTQALYTWNVFHLAGVTPIYIYIYIFAPALIGYAPNFRHTSLFSPETMLSRVWRSDATSHLNHAAVIVTTLL